MEYLIISLTALAASGLTLFSGFGLGTILMPVMALFFPPDLAISLTAIVHLLNNLLKLTLFARHATMQVLVPFGLTAIPAAFLGGRFLLWLADREPMVTYALFEHMFSITPVNAVIALLMVIFALAELLPFSRSLRFPTALLPIGGLLSGFFGGLSGHQGALRSAFLIRTGLSKERFIGTGVVLACLVDATRLTVYGAEVGRTAEGQVSLLICAVLSAFAGTVIGSRMLRQVTLQGIQVAVAVLLFIIAAGLGAGMI